MVASAAVVCSTLSGCGQVLLQGSFLTGAAERFELIVMDEACNATAPAALVALQLLNPVRGACAL